MTELSKNSHKLQATKYQICYKYSTIYFSETIVGYNTWIKVNFVSKSNKNHSAFLLEETALGHARFSLELQMNILNWVEVTLLDKSWAKFNVAFI